MNETRKNVTLEDLLRVKRAEQPPPEFWEAFDRGMRTKQLAAIVEPRPWWAPFIRVGARISRYQLPVGAAAILAITFVTLREYRSTEIRPIYEPAVTAMVPAPIAALPSTNIAPANAQAAVAVAESSARSDARVEEVEEAGDRSLDSVGVASHVAPAPVELTPSARYIAENFAAARAADPELDQMLGRSIRSLEARTARTEPLAQVNMPAQTRRARLLAGTSWLASANASGDSTLRTDDQSTRRLTERRLSEIDAVSRIDVGGSRLTVKF